MKALYDGFNFMEEILLSKDPFYDTKGWTSGMILLEDTKEYIKIVVVSDEHHHQNNQMIKV